MTAESQNNPLTRIGRLCWGRIVHLTSREISQAEFASWAATDTNSSLRVSCLLCRRLEFVNQAYLCETCRKRALVCGLAGE
jgi:hypothetical protein